jgi:hypothetical protein
MARQLLIPSANGGFLGPCAGPFVEERIWRARRYGGDNTWSGWMGMSPLFYWDGQIRGIVDWKVRGSGTPLDSHGNMPADGTVFDAFFQQVQLVFPGCCPGRYWTYTWTLYCTVTVTNNGQDFDCSSGFVVDPTVIPPG